MPCATNAAPAAVVVALAEPVRARLRRLAASVTAQVRQALRAKIVLAAADGLANAAIAREPKASVNTVRSGRGRFVSGGLATLHDAKRLGGPRTYGSQVRVRVVAAATGAPAHPESSWSHRGIAVEVAGMAFAAISPSQAGRILADLDLEPHRPRGWLTRRDTPDFWQRAAGICDVCLNPPGGAVVLSFDKRCAPLAEHRDDLGAEAVLPAVQERARQSQRCLRRPADQRQSIAPTCFPHDAHRRHPPSRDIATGKEASLPWQLRSRT
ncbi:hypothetical protein QF037_000749 [Streptomyces canus]|uniref:hypothetical protein n=1 Tax=Streptomyces canus TaxID=58343 RepID=UPI00277EE75B|nr:hypothetical protein [Streptomyces canus]MDQ0596404.1 hypothetical protein [Streptomyces canus]